MSAQNWTRANLCLASAVSEQKGSKIDIKLFGKKRRISKRKFTKSRVFPINLVKKWNKRCFTELQGHMNTQEMLRVVTKHTFESISQVMRVFVQYRQGQTQSKKSSTSKTYLDQTFLSMTVCTLKSSQHLLQTSQLSSRSAVYICCLWNRIEKFWKIRQKLRKPTFWQILASCSWQSSINDHQNSLLYTLLKLFLNSGYIHYVEARWAR